MNQPRVSKAVLRRAEDIVADALTPIFEEALNNATTTIDSLITQPKPLPVVTFEYPRAGKGGYVTRFVRVTEMTDTHLRGFEIESEFDEEPGKPHSYLVEKISGAGVQLRHLSKE